MLRGMVLENFVHFKKRCTLDFSKTKQGPNIFVGASSTGKTAILELIRRCMDMKLNSSLTNRCNESETAYVFCEFENENEKYGPTVISGMIVERRQEDNDDEEEEKWSQKADTIFHKIIIYFYNKEIKFCSKTYFKTPDDRIVDLRKNVRLSKDLLAGKLDESFFSASNVGQTNKNDQSSSGIYLFNIEFVEKVLDEIRKQQIENKAYTRYPKVWGELEESFVGVLSMRGMGTFQWTKSKKMDDKFRSTNYEETCAQAEIISELMGIEHIDKTREQEIFDFLTSGSNFKFVKKSNSEIVVQKSGREFALLKTSVGIIEAKQFSLLMSHDRLKTICLEEPDRGMHPQMIERMKEVLHHESRTKTIIVVTHSPFFIDFTSLINTFFFSRGENDAIVVDIYKELKENDCLKMLGTTEFKTILFSSNVLFVEGPTDKLVLEAIFRKVKERSKSFDENFSILSHEICSMRGKGMAKKIKDFCNVLKIKFRILVDRDSMITTENSKIKTICKDFKVGNEPMSVSISDFLEKGFDEFSDHLAKNENMLIWKHGELEDFLLSESEKSLKICEILNPGLKEKRTKNKPNTESNETNVEGKQNFHDEKIKMSTDEDEEKKYKKMKSIITNALKDAISRDTLDELAAEIIDFPETKRLLSFLKKKTDS